MKELEDDVMDRVQSFCAQGDIWVEDGDYAGAIAQFEHALALIPAPVTDWEAATWVLSAIGDTRFLMGDFSGGHDALAEAVQCPDGLGNPFVHLRLGQCCYELGHMERAADELTRAYMGDGEEIFASEDAKYFEWVKSKLDGIGEEAAVTKPWWKFW